MGAGQSGGGMYCANPATLFFQCQSSTALAVVEEAYLRDTAAEEEGGGGGQDAEMIKGYSLPYSPSPGTPATKLVYIERVTSNKAAGSEMGSTTGGFSAPQSLPSSHSTVGRAMAVLQTAGAAALAVPPGKLDKAKLQAFTEGLENAGLDLTRWGVSGTKSVEHLFWEAYQQRGCLITGLGGGSPGPLKRVTRLVKIRLTAEIFGVVHTLFSRMQFMHDGQSIERKQVPLRRLLWHPDAEDMIAKQSKEEVSDSFYAETCPHTEDWRTGCRKALEERLGLSERWQQQHLLEDGDSYSYHTEDDVKSDGYPGLNTLYCIHEVTFRVMDPEHAQVQCIGLPQGQEFATTEGDFNFVGHTEDGLPIGSQLNIWTWARGTPPARGQGASPRGQPPPGPRPHMLSRLGSVEEKELLLIKRVHLPATAATAIAGMKMRIGRQLHHPPSSTLFAAMEKQRTDWEKVKKMAKSITDPKYTLADFMEDLSAFPELNLYLLQESPPGGKGDAGGSSASMVTKTSSMSSGRTIGDEYQRTVGAFFAIYWLMRLQGDGKEGFSFGVDDEWRPLDPDKCSERRLHPRDKRLKFYREGRWDYFNKLLLNAGLLKEERKFMGRGTALRVNEKRLVSLLALTAIHDIMKMALMCPTVQQRDAPYHGYVAGDTISDHDHALSYLMDHYPDLLPSFRALDPEEKRSVHFTQCNLCFNHGWFVQAEAPPGATFTKFRDALIRDHKSQIGAQDVAMYFVHWLTDLAGAEPTPLGGCEKFVVKFPLEVLNSFLRSFEMVQKIADKTETEVMEEYLKVRWVEHQPSLGPLPTGDSAIARMRILCMAQMNAEVFLKAFDQLQEEDQEVLNTELSRTGTLCQSYSHELVPKDVHLSPAGPAFLVYYGPAFLQNLGNDCPVQRLSVLAEVYRRARELWPLNVAKAAQNVIVRVDMIKGLSTGDMQEANNKGDVWLMMKHNESEAFIERSSKRKLNKLIALGQPVQVLEPPTGAEQGRRGCN